jgi:hypothetical protein
VANSYDGSNRNINSVIYKFNSTTFMFDPVQFIRTQEARDWEHFEMNGNSFLVVANYDSGTTTNLNSVVYRFNPTNNTFESFQSIPTNGATTWKYFEMAIWAAPRSWW